MNDDSQTTQLCILGTQAEFAGDLTLAQMHYRQAWEAAESDFERCIAAHYLARCFIDPVARLEWNRAALHYAERSKDERTAAFFPSLYLCLGQSYEHTGELALAQEFYDRAANLGFPHDLGYQG